MSVIHQYVDKVYVINLDKDRERMKHMDEQCKQHQINYVRFPAIVGKNIKADSRLSPTCQLFCTDGSKGCGLSHHSIWEDMVKNNITTALILEDDCVFEKDFDSKVHSAMKEIPQTFDIIYLTSLYNPKNTNVISKCVHSLAGIDPEDYSPSVKKTKGAFGTGAYIIHIDFIKKIIDKPITQIIDYQLSKWIQELNTNAYVLSEFPISQNAEGFESNLGDTFPLGLNTMLKQVKLDDNPDMSWILNENIIKILGFNVNLLIVLLCILVFVTPKHYLYVWGIWLVGEGLLAMDIQNTFRYGVFLGGAAVLSFYLQNRFLKARRRR